VVVPAARLAAVGAAVGAVPAALDARVVVLTVAQAKGLEFDSVVVVDRPASCPARRAARTTCTSPSPAPPAGSGSCTSVTCWPCWRASGVPEPAGLTAAGALGAVERAG
jgi:hypothetical protein